MKPVKFPPIYQRSSPTAPARRPGGTAILGQIGAALLPLAKSWLQPPPAEVGKGARVVFDPAQRAWILTREIGKVDSLELTLAASEDSRLVNPSLMVENWGRASEASITIDGRPVPESADLRLGVVSRPNGVNALVVWMEHQSAKPTTIRVQLESPGLDREP